MLICNRLLKESADELTLLVASASAALSKSYPASLTSAKLGFTLKFKGGDHSVSLTKVNESLLAASEYAATENQKQMLIDYVESFEHGDIAAHKEGSRKWVKDIGPVIETYIG